MTGTSATYRVDTATWEPPASRFLHHFSRSRALCDFESIFHREHGAFSCTRAQRSPSGCSMTPRANATVGIDREAVICSACGEERQGPIKNRNGNVRKVSVLALHGTEDRINPYWGDGDPSYWNM